LSIISGGGRRTAKVGDLVIQLGSTQTAFIIAATITPGNVSAALQRFGVEYVYTIGSQQYTLVGPVGITDGTTYFGNTVFMVQDAGISLTVTCNIFTDNPSEVEFNGQASLCFAVHHVTAITDGYVPPPE
jgi:hypothetical protein